MHKRVVKIIREKERNKLNIFKHLGLLPEFLFDLMQSRKDFWADLKKICLGHVWNQMLSIFFYLMIEL